MTYSLASKIASKNKIDLIEWQYQLYDRTRKPYREIFITSSWTFTKIHVYIDMKPVLLTVDDEPQVLIAIEHDLKLRYGNRFRILQASTGQKGLDLTKQLKLSNELVASPPDKKIAIVMHHHPAAVGTPLIDHYILKNTNELK